MSILIKVISPNGIITATDSREVYSETDKNSGKKVFVNHFDGVAKTYIKGRYLISICGNANINSLQIKDIFPNFLNKLDDTISFSQLTNEIFNLYKESINSHSTSYYISFYDKATLNSKYYKYFKIEPFLFILKTKEQMVKRLNADEDGFTFGIFWGGVSDKVELVLREKRNSIDANNLTIDNSIDFIRTTISDVLQIFTEKDEYPTVGGDIDLFIQTMSGIETRIIKTVPNTRS